MDGRVTRRGEDYSVSRWKEVMFFFRQCEGEKKNVEECYEGEKGRYYGCSSK